MNTDPRSRKLAVIGLGYVGLPLAVAFARHGFSVIGFDVNEARLQELARGFDQTREVPAADLRAAPVHYTTKVADLKAADFFIITVPTPVDAQNVPDLTAVLGATQTVATVLKRGDIVVYESTVYPGATEEDCIPVLEQRSGLRFQEDFAVGYSPERINPGDMVHRFETITKVVSASSPEALAVVAAVYGAVVKAGVHLAPNIRTAEAAKVIENTQRDVNIALMNELALICHRLRIDTQDVLAAAGTKWNFLKFTPGLVGGHCIGVDPYYLTHRAQQAGYGAPFILAGRTLNNHIAGFIAQETVRLLDQIRGGNRQVVVLGATFKENVPDIRNSKVKDIVDALRAQGLAVSVADPEAHADEFLEEFGLPLTPLSDLPPAGAVVLAVAHRAYRDAGWPLVQACLPSGRGVVMDVKAILPREERPDGVTLWRL